MTTKTKLTLILFTVLILLGVLLAVYMIMPVQKDVAQDSGMIDPQSIEVQDSIPDSIKTLLPPTDNMYPGITLTFKNIQVDTYDDYKTYTINYENTDTIDMVFIYNDPNTEDFAVRQNKYTSEYPNIYFYNGIPSNAEDIYTACVAAGYYDIYMTNYVEGDSEVQLIDAITGETLVV